MNYPRDVVRESDRSESELSKWHIDKKVPIALIVSMFIQTGAFVWWVARADARIESLEVRVAAAAPLVERIVRVETKIDGVNDTLGDIKQLLRPR